MIDKYTSIMSYHLIALICCIVLSNYLYANEPSSATARIQNEQQQRIEMIAKASRTAICIFDEKLSAGGSGVIISPEGYGITNYHVIAPLLKTKKGLGGLSDGKRYPLKVLGIDPTGDVAMFQLTGKDRFDWAPLGNSDRLRTGDPVIAIGNPFMLAEDYTPTVTYGTISGLHRYQYGAEQRSLVYTDCIQVDASINPGNSGGPLFNMSGEVIGINGRAAFEQRGRINVGLAFAISINQIKRFIPGLRAGLLVEHGSLGATVINREHQQVIFDRILEDSTAYKAGIRIGDRLIRFAGRKIYNANQFANILGTYPAGWSVEVTWEHNNQPQTKLIELDRLPANIPAKIKEQFKIDPAVTRAEVEASPSNRSATTAPAGNALTQSIEHVLQRTVKIYGAKIGTEHGYGTGIIVSPDGQVVTVQSLILAARNLRAVTLDGLVYPAKVTYRDNYRQLALLQMEHNPVNIDIDRISNRTTSFPFFDLSIDENSKPASSGDWVLSVGNPFKVADGPEAMSVTKGIISGRTNLQARSGTQPFPYRGEVILVDAIISNPGSPGSALVDLEGRCLGMAGKIVTSAYTNTLLNYAYPSKEIQAFMQDAESGTKTEKTIPTESSPGYHGIRLSKIGFRRQLPFVKSIAKDSPADTAGVQPDDLIVSANGTPIPRARAFTQLCKNLRAGDTLSVVIKRGEQLITIRMTLTEPPQ